MAIEINEFVGNDFFSKTIESAKALDGVNVTEASNTQSINQNIDPDSLMVEIEAIHAYPHATRNFTRYMPKGLKNSVPSWTNPYNRPLIKHHNEENGKIIGRVLEAKYIENKLYKKLVWFKISKYSGEYYITMYYDNEYNMAHGEDL